MTLPLPLEIAEETKTPVLARSGAERAAIEAAN